MIATQTIVLRLKDVWTISRNSSTAKTNVLVRLERDGVVGYGEAAPNVRYGETPEQTEQMIALVGRTLEGEDLTAYRQIKTLVDRTIDGQNCARAAVDIAVMDWAAKRLGVPLHRLFGLNAQQTPLTSYSIGIDKPDVVRQKTRQAEAYPILKIKVGATDDEAMIDAVRSVTDKPLRVDANEGWTDKETAIRKIEWMQSKGVELIEQPMPAKMIEETAWLRQRAQLPLVADEAVMCAADIPPLAGVYDGINIKLMKAGGIQEAMGMIHTARAVGLKVMLGCMIESSIAIGAAAQISPLADWADLDGNLLIDNDPFGGIEVSGGRLVLGLRPGIGVDGVW